MTREWLATLRLRCRCVVQRRRFHRDLDEELQFHLAALADRHYLAGGDPVEAQCFARRKFGNTTLFQEVCRDMWTFRIKYAALSEPAAPSIYFPHEQFTVRRMVVTIRTSFDNRASLIPAVRRELKAMDPAIPPQFAVYSDVISASVARQRIGAALLSVFAIVALILAAVGIYGLMSYSATQPSGEIAVRTALGVTAGEVLGMIVRRGLMLAAAGIVVGVTGAVALRQVIASQLYEVSALDPRVFVLVPLALLAVALLSCCHPPKRLIGCEMGVGSKSW